MDVCDAWVWVVVFTFVYYLRHTASKGLHTPNKRIKSFEPNDDDLMEERERWKINKYKRQNTAVRCTFNICSMYLVFVHHKPAIDSTYILMYTRTRYTRYIGCSLFVVRLVILNFDLEFIPNKSNNNKSDHDNNNQIINFISLMRWNEKELFWIYISFSSFMNSIVIITNV